MTAEIAILNRSGVALAADSAVTLTTAKGQKIYNTANKIFALSKHAPVGLMTFGDADIMWLPLELVVKAFRAKLGETRYDHLEDYGNAFVEFLSQGSLFPHEYQERFVTRCSNVLARDVRVEIDQEAANLTAAGTPPTRDQVEALTSARIQAHFDEYEARSYIEGFGEVDANEILQAFGEVIDASLDYWFEQLPVTPTARAQLRAIVSKYFVRNWYRVNRIGVLIAGYGEDDMFPRLVEYTMEGCVAGRLKSVRSAPVHIDTNTESWTIPRAQDDVVWTFLEGINRDLRAELEGHLAGLLRGYTARIAQRLQPNDVQAQQGIQAALLPDAEALSEQVAQKLDELSKRHSDPIIDIVAFLPKDELAEMAETLVNVTSFRRRMSSEVETVGGPVDVAVISKGDGFVWIKRKNYLKAELNPHFFRNYY